MTALRPWLWLAAALVALAVFFALPAPPAAAHALSVASADIAVRGDEATVTVLFDGAKAIGLDGNRDGHISQAELDASLEGLLSRLKAAVVLAAPDAPSAVTLTRYELADGDHVVRLVLDERFAGPVRRLSATAHMGALMTTPTPLVVSLEVHGKAQQALLAQEGQGASFAAGRSPLEVFASFLRMGVEHIFTGYDHLAFLMCLLLGANSRRSLLWTVTAFTLAHSVTLALSTLDIVRIPAPLVEAAIAATIIYVAVENLIGTRLVNRPWITGGFGFIHGFGFASALREVGLPPGQTALSLAAFNLGVEIGQLAFLGAALVVLGKFVTSPRLRTAVSAGAVCVAVFWLVQRVALIR